MKHSAVWMACLLTLSACPGDTGVKLVRVQFNGTDDVASMRVAPDASQEDVEIDLSSTTGQISIGRVTISPGGGAVGTQHRVELVVFDEWEDRVKEVFVDAETENRGSRTLALVQDSADLGVWIQDLKSYGVDGEARTDTFRFTLYEYVPEAEVQP